MNAAFRAANRAYDDTRLNDYLARQDEYDRLQQWEQSIVDRAAEMLSPDASAADKRDVEHELARSAASHSFAVAALELMAARPLLASLDVPPHVRTVLDDLIGAADNADVDVRREIENAIRLGRLT